MRKFKIGDKVRCVDDKSSSDVRVGKVYTVSGFNPSLGNYSRRGIGVLLEEFPSDSVGFFEDRFVLEKEPFNLNKATDQEIADNYRRLILEARPFRQALLDRGFKFLRKHDLKPFVFCEMEDTLIQKEEKVVTKL